ncbi:hypothetical protein FKM82_018473 [Ascaphus truei]
MIMSRSLHPHQNHPPPSSVVRFSMEVPSGWGYLVTGSINLEVKSGTRWYGVSVMKYSFSSPPICEVTKMGDICGWRLSKENLSLVGLQVEVQQIPNLSPS